MHIYDIRVKSSKAVRACTIRLLNLGPAKHEEAAIHAVNQRIPNILELRELFYSGAIRGYQMRGKIPFDPHIIYFFHLSYVMPIRIYFCMLQVSLGALPSLTSPKALPPISVLKVFLSNIKPHMSACNLPFS